MITTRDDYARALERLRWGVMSMDAVFGASCTLYIPRTAAVVLYVVCHTFVIFACYDAC